jgi:hypothetical protein
MWTYCFRKQCLYSIPVKTFYKPLAKRLYINCKKGSFPLSSAGKFPTPLLNKPIMELPILPLKEWEKTKMTLHLFMQIVGKIKLKKMPRKNHWWNITLLVNAKGITTNTVANGAEAFEIQFNFIEHLLEVSTSKGEYESFSLHDGLSVAEFYTKLLGILDKLKIEVHLVNKPYSLPDVNPITTPFDQLTEYSSYEAVYVERFWKIMLWVNSVFTEFAGKFYGKTCPVQLYWHHLDLTVTRFSGKKVPLAEGMSIANKDAYSHEVISFGFWVGDENVDAPAFYSYTYPSPGGLENTPLKPSPAKWQMSNGSPMALLMYDDIRTAEDPSEQVMDFLESAYAAGSSLAGWNVEEMKVPELKEL